MANRMSDLLAAGRPPATVAAKRGAWRLGSLVKAASLPGAELILRVPLLRDYLLGKLLESLDTCYDQTEQDQVLLDHIRWFASHLGPFLRRLIEERPAAALAVLRFIGTWTTDVYRRTDAQLTGRVTPCTVVIEPTDRCNLNCPGCYAKSTADGCDLPYERLLQVVGEVIQMGVTLVTISGGEPFLRERADSTLTRLAGRFRDRGFLVYTNGTLIDAEIAKALGRLGNIFPAISVEGFEHQTDARRGRGVYEHIRSVRRMLAGDEVMTGFSATVTRENAEAIASDDFIDLRIEEGDLFGWFFLLQPIGRSPRADLMVTADQRAMLYEAVTRWRIQQRPIFLGDFWNDGYLTGGCIAGGRYYFHIYANGDISPCVFAPVACGNIFDIIAGRSKYSSLADLVQNHPVFRAFRSAQEEVRLQTRKNAFGGLVTDRARPCLLIDHPHLFRRISRMPGCIPAKNMSAGYLDGQIAAAIDQAARDWQVRARTLSDPLSMPAKCGVGDPKRDLTRLRTPLQRTAN